MRVCTYAGAGGSLIFVVPAESFGGRHTAGAPVDDGTNSSRTTGMTLGAVMPIDNWPREAFKTVTAISSPMYTVSPAFLVSISMVNLLLTVIRHLTV